jgi:hypothetical protein
MCAILQGYWLPRKFGDDNRETHFSSLVSSGKLTRATALESLTHLPYPVAEQEADVAYVLKKLELWDKEFQSLLDPPPRRYEDYPNDLPLRRKLRLLTRHMRRVRIPA